LIAFEDRVITAERDEGLVLRKHADDLFRQERKNRAAFKILLEALVEQGKVNAESLWRIVYPDIAEVETVVVSMLGCWRSAC
jgi:hypothetical protein